MTSQADAMERVGGSRLQHGPLSERVYLMHLKPEDVPRVLKRMHQLADSRGYGKLFAKVPGRTARDFLREGFRAEAEIPDFYHDGDAALFLSKFLCRERGRAGDADELKRVLGAAAEKAGKPSHRPSPDCEPLELGTSDAPRMAGVYAEVFESYPFPVFDPDYLRRTMRENFRYFGALRGGELLALASCEMDDGCVEMTDFATLPGHRSGGLAGLILRFMEERMRESGMKTAFTIARARSFGVNILFSRAGYAFAGTLVNNTAISGGLESMNVWYKPLGA
jgi:putative beta-lysine N-acetyltransferase